jgi:hypothetical protein
MTLPSQLSDEEIRVVREALTGRPSWLELARALEAEATTHDSEALKMLSLAFIYDLISPSQDARRTTAGSPYASMIESDLGCFHLGLKKFLRKSALFGARHAMRLMTR